MIEYSAYVDIMMNQTQTFPEVAQSNERKSNELLVTDVDIGI